MDHLHYSLKRIGEVASGGVVNLFCHYNSTTSYRQLNHRILTSELTVNIKVCKEDMQCYPLIYDVNMTVNFIFVTLFGKSGLNENYVEPFFIATDLETLECIGEHS